MKLFKDRWEVFVVLLAVALAATGGHFRARSLAENAKSFEKRLLDTEWRLGEDGVLRAVK